MMFHRPHPHLHASESAFGMVIPLSRREGELRAAGQALADEVRELGVADVALRRWDELAGVGRSVA